MRILLGISLLVLVAILWTGISILRHIRLTQRRNRFLREQQSAEHAQTMVSLRSDAFVTPLPARFAAPILTPDASPEPAIARPEAADSLPAPVPTLESAKDTAEMQPVEAGSDLETTATAERPGPFRLRPLAPRVPEAQPEPTPLRIHEVAFDPADRDIFPTAPAFPSLLPSQQSVPPPPAAVPPPVSTQGRRPVRSVHHQIPGARPAHRPDWIYFNKDMGDLSDPAPSRIRVRSR